MEKKPQVVEEEEENSITEADVAGDNSNRKFGTQTRFSDRDSPKPTSPAGQENNNKFQVEDQLTSTQAEVGEAREENERLKKVLSRIVKDYNALQMHFFDIVQKDQVNYDPPKITSEPIDLEEPELVSLRLGTSSSGHKKEEKIIKEDDNRKKEGLALGLDSKFGSTCINNIIDTKLVPISSPDNSSEDAKEEEAGEPWPPSKMAKNLRSSGDEVTPQALVKRARVSVRARCDTPTMNDGCQWRKYGQKVSKGNPCPRAYYRCTVAPLCPVRKQVQRCAEDMSILITTYEGTHNHPLPVSATAMASTTSAAACMLTSGSSAPRLAGSSSSSTSAPSSSTSAYPLGLNYIRPSHQFYLPNQLTTSSNSHPTITLDLTNKYSSRYNPTPTTFNFSSLESNPIPTWSSNSSYNGTHTSTNYPLNQTYWQRAANSALTPTPAPNNLSTDTIARAVTSDPSFQSALAAAITSYVGTRGGDHSNGYGLRFLNRTGSLGSSHREGSLGPKGADDVEKIG